MKIIANLTQTYGNDRNNEIYDFLDIQNIKVLKTLDIVTFSFHNSSDEFIAEAKKMILIEIPNCIFFEFRDITYAESILLYIDNLKKLGVTDFLLWQDDHYFNQYIKSLKIWDVILKKYREDDNIKYLKVFGVCYHLIERQIKFETTTTLKDNVRLYKTYTDVMSHSRYWSYTDENYLINIDFATTHFFTKFISHLDVWELEKHLKRLSDSSHLPIYMTNAYLFERCGINGPNKNEYSTSKKTSFLKAKKYNENIYNED